QLDEELLEMLHWGEFDNIDLKISPYNYDLGGKKGVSAYLKSMFAILHEDDLDKKHAHIPIDNGMPQLPLEAPDDPFGADVVSDTGRPLADVQRRLHRRAPAQWEAQRGAAGRSSGSPPASASARAAREGPGEHTHLRPDEVGPVRRGGMVPRQLDPDARRL